jgi:activator of HSP90 ATPase
MEKGFQLSELFPVRPEEIYQAWLSSQEHSAMTGSPAYIEGAVGGEFRAWDGYISGRTLELSRNQRIVQAWRTSEFPDGAPDSRIELLLEEVDGGTKVTLIHTHMPEDQVESYRQGWEDFYFKPMRQYFSGLKSKPVAKP